MIHFFRRIRQMSLSDGKLSKYLVYALGEILLVVFGILIALQINNWNESRKKDKLITSYLYSLLDDLHSDIKGLEYTETVNLFRYNSAQYLLQTADLPEYTISNDGMLLPQWQEEDNFIWRKNIPTHYDTTFVKLAFLWTHRMGYPIFTKSTIEELNNTGLFSQLPVALKDEIREYQINIGFRFGNIETYLPVVTKWQESLLVHGVQNGNPFIYGDPIELIKKDMLVSGRLRGLTRQAAWMAEGVPIIIKDANDLVDLINQHLKESLN